MAKDVDVRVKATVEGAESIQKTTDSLDKMADAGGKAGSAVASTTKSTSNFGDLLGKLPGPLGGAASGIMSMTKAALQFLATPIGAVIGTIGVILAAFTKAIQNSDKAMDSLSEITEIFGQIVRPIFAFLETIAVNVLEKVADGLEVVANLFGNAGTAGRSLASSLDELEDAERDFNVQQAKTNAQIAEAREIMSDSNATFEERKKALEDVRKVEEANAAQALKNAKERLEIAEDEIIMHGRSTAAIDKQAEAQQRVYEAQQKASAQQRQFNKLQKQLDAEEAAKEKEKQKAAEDAAKEAAAKAKERADAAIAIKKEALKAETKAVDEAYLASIKDEELRAREALVIAQKNQDAELQVKIDALEKIKKRTKEENAALAALKAQQAAEDAAQIVATNNLLDEQEKARKAKKLEDDKKAFDDRLKAIDDEYKKESLLLIQSDAKTEQEKEEIKKKQDQLDLDRIQKKIDAATAAQQETIDLEIELANKKKQLADEEEARDAALFQQKMDNYQKYLAMASGVINQISGLVQVNQTNEINAINRKYAAQLAAAEGDKEAIAQIEAAKLAESNAIKKKQFDNNKKLQYATALINGAVAVGSIIAQYPKFDGGIMMTAALVAAGITLAAQLIKIKNTEFVPDEGGGGAGAGAGAGGAAGGGKSMFADGGLVSGPGTGTSDSIAARLSNGESVINARSTEMFSGLLSLINQAGGGRPFAEGGATAPGSMTIPVIKTYVVASEMTSQQEADFRIQQVARL
jgi:hypothetical protein